jgi:hypothetical protein
MHNLPAPVVVSIEISSLAGLEGSRDWVAFAERAAVASGGRPHWGQEHHLTGAEVEQFYGDGLERWREALRSVSGTAGPFSNAFTRRCGLEPAPVPRGATVGRVQVDRYSLEGASGRPETSWVFEPDRLTATAVDFGDVELGQARLCYISIENAGASPLQVGTVDLGGGLSLAGLRIEVETSSAATGRRAEIRLVYMPSQVGPVTGTLTVRTNAPTTPELRIVLRGRRMVTAWWSTGPAWTSARSRSVTPPSRCCN